MRHGPFPLCFVTAGISAQLAANNGVIPEQQSYLGNLAMVKGGGLEKYWTESEVYRCKVVKQDFFATGFRYFKSRGSSP